MKVLIATQNEGKIEGAKRAFSKFYDNIEIIGIPADSEVGDQPVNEDIYTGAKNRVKNLKIYAKEHDISADYYISIESGIQNLLGDWMITNIAIIEDSTTYASTGTSASFPVPEKYVKDIIDTDLAKVMDRVYYMDEKRHSQGGAVYDITHNTVTRIDLTESAFVMALTKFINGDLWK